jgi:pilus assembly protein CpaB
MPLRTALFAAILLGLGGLGLIAWIGVRLPQRATVATETSSASVKVTVLVAAHPLRAGSLLKFDDIEPREMIASEVATDARTDTPTSREELAGSMLRRGLQPQEILRSADLLRPGDHGFLAAVLRPGMRATTVGVDAVSGTAGLIWPGDHVDVILTQLHEDQLIPVGHRASAETVLADVQVIAIDQQLMQGATAASPDPGAAHTVTLEVTADQAERVALAGRLGHLSLIVRAADSQPDSRTGKPTTTWGGDVSPALDQGHAAARSMRVYHGTTEGQELRF